MKEIKKGDLVTGVKPWNKFARLGVVISEPISTGYDSNKCRVFWYAPEPSAEFQTKKTFVLEELLCSIEKMEKEDVSIQQDRS
tara:strand:- start:4264 stop:4512 length:249 start_codon:yes stop_codon:yes gene_type:complete